MAKPVKKKRLGQSLKNRRRQQILVVAVIALACILFCFGLSYYRLYKYVHKVPDGVIWNGITIGDVDVSGMTLQQAEASLTALEQQYGQLVMTIGVKEQTCQATFEELGFEIRDKSELVAAALNVGRKGSLRERYKEVREVEKSGKNYPLVYEFRADNVNAILGERAAQYETAAVNASIRHVGDGFEITEGVQGNRINYEASLEKMNKFLNEMWEFKDANLKMVLATTEPQIKADQLGSIKDLLGSYWTEASGTDRIINIARAASLINGTILMPGEELSVEEKISPIDEDNGYVAGSAYENGEVVESIGGGLCQMSTTLYNAVLYAELEVTRRYAHSMIVTYVDPSRDAAIAEGVKDFKFVNDTDAPILIEGFMDEETVLHFNIYGTEYRPAGHSVEYESETLERTEYTTNYVADPDSPIGSFETEGSAINGRTARLWKVVYENDTEVSRDIINNSTYNASKVTVKVGTASSNAEAVQLVNQAIGSQDGDTIKSAVAEAKRMR